MMVEVAIIIIDLHSHCTLDSGSDLSANEGASMIIHGAMYLLTDGGNEDLIELEATYREHVVLHKVSDESP
jgi:hypothetical protein